MNFNPQWRPSNPETIVFISRSFNPYDLPHAGPGNLAIVKTDGSGFRPPDEDNLTHTLLPALSPAGKKIANDRGGEYTSEDGILTPWLHNLEEESIPFDYASYGFTIAPDLSFGRASWSPDGRFLAWVVGDLSGDGERLARYVSPQGGLRSFWVKCPDGTDNQFIDQAISPIWSPDSNLLVYLQLADGAIMVMETGQWQPQRTDLPLNTNPNL